MTEPTVIVHGGATVFKPEAHPDTIKAIEEELLVDGLIFRYMNDDGLPGRSLGKNSFL